MTNSLSGFEKLRPEIGWIPESLNQDDLETISDLLESCYEK